MWSVFLLVDCYLPFENQSHLVIPIEGLSIEFILFFERKVSRKVDKTVSLLGYN